MVVETDRDVFAEAVVLEQQFQLRTDDGGVDVVWALPTQDMFSAFGQHTLEAEFVDQFGDVVGIDQLGVAEHLRRDAKQGLNLLRVLAYLGLEFLRIA